MDYHKLAHTRGRVLEFFRVFGVHTFLGARVVNTKHGVFFFFAKRADEYHPLYRLVNVTHNTIQRIGMNFRR